MATCPHLGPFDDGVMPCTRQTPHDPYAATGHEYAASGGVHGLPVRDEE